MKSKPIDIASLVSAKNRQPYVTLRLGEEVGQLPPGQAREVGRWLIEAAEAAEQDAAMMRFCRERLDLDDQRAVLLLRDLRLARGKGKRTGSAEEAEDGR